MVSNNGSSAAFKSGAQTISNTGQLYPVAVTNNGRNMTLAERKARLVQLRLQSDNQFAEMLRDPTIRLAATVVTAMLIAQPWVSVGEDEDINDFMMKQIAPYRTMLIRSAMRGMLKHGWRAIETAFTVSEDAPVFGDTKNVLAGVKPLRNSLTDVLVYEETGNMAGVESRDFNGNVIQIDEDHIILVNADEDYLGALGDPFLRNAQETHRKWERCDKGAQRYDDKVAGGFLAIGYPEGKFNVETDEGTIEKVDGSVIGKKFADQIKASGFGLYPRKPNPDTGEYTQGDWAFDHVMASGSGMQPNFVARLKYLDALKLRLFGIPERTLTEGSFGTKAEAEAHASIAFVANLERAEFVIHGINEGFSKPLCRANFGDENASAFGLGDMSDEDKTFYSTILTALLKDPTFSEETILKIDLDQVLRELDIPTLSPTEQEKLRKKLAERKQEAMAQQQEAMQSQDPAANTSGGAASSNASAK